MTNRQKAESCGEFVRDGLDALRDLGRAPQPSSQTHWQSHWNNERYHIVQAARQAGHWGRLALAELAELARKDLKLRCDAAEAHRELYKHLS